MSNARESIALHVLQKRKGVDQESEGAADQGLSQESAKRMKQESGKRVVAVGAMNQSE